MGWVCKLKVIVRTTQGGVVLVKVIVKEAWGGGVKVNAVDKMLKLEELLLKLKLKFAGVVVL